MRLGIKEEKKEEEKEGEEMEKEKCKPEKMKNGKNEAVVDAISGQGLESQEGAQGTGSLLGQEAENDSREGGSLAAMFLFSFILTHSKCGPQISKE